MSNTTDEGTRFQVGMLAFLGKSDRDIADQLGIAKGTVRGIKASIADAIDDRPAAQKKIDPSVACDNCRIRPVSMDSEFYRPTRRTKHKFCSGKCYGEFMQRSRADDRCKRCNMRRGDKLCAIFSRGYCQKCYGLLREFNWDENLVTIHEQNQKLKGELSGKKRNG